MTSIKKLKIGIVGGTGYTGVELLRLLALHPHAELVAITSRGEAGLPVADMFPSLRGYVDLSFVDPASADLGICDVVFFATPNGIAMQQTRALLDKGVRVIDLAADFRIRDVAVWEKWYGMQHACPDLIGEAVYGLPEFNRAQIRNARLIANPGCYPTAVQLGFMPLLQAGVVDPSGLIADAKSGVSGAGRKAEVHTLFAEAADNFKAYGVGGHRHLPEISQGLSNIAGMPVGLTFVPHLTPLIRGIHATLYARLKTSCDLQQLFEETYHNEHFVDVLPVNSSPGNAFGACFQSLPYSRAPTAGWRYCSGSFGDRQSGQRCCRSSRAEHEYHVWLAGAYRTGSGTFVAVRS